MMADSLHGVRAVLFDLDGTLLDSAPDLAAAANVIRRNSGLDDLPLSNYRPFVGTGARGMLKIALGLLPEAPEFELCRDEFFQAYEELLMQHSDLFAGVPQLVERLELQGLSWGIVTNKSERFALPIARQSATLGRAAVIVCGDTTPYSKPHPGPLQHACKCLGVLPEQAIYVGDDERDMQAAQAAGMRRVAADYGYLGGVDSTASWNPDAAIKKPLDLLTLLGLN